MATGTILLWPGAVTLPDGTTDNLFAQAEVVKSTGTPPANGVNLHFTQLLFDGTVAENVFFGFLLPADYASGGTLTIHWKRASGTGAADVVWKAAAAALTPGGTEVPNTKAHAAVTTVTSAAGTTSQALRTTALSPNMDGAAAGDTLYLVVSRDGDNASDTLDAVDAQVTAIAWTYTTA